MNIALVVHDFDPGLGQGRYALELARRFSPAHSVDIYANTFASELLPGWRFIRVPAWRRSALLSIFTFLLRAEALVRRHPHDVVHAQGLTCWGADVITAHVCNPARYRIAPPVRLRSRLFPALVNPVETRFYRQARARHVIAISRQVASEVRRFYGWERPLTVIHHGVDSTLFRPPKDLAERQACRNHFQLPATGTVWLFVGEATKGLELVVRQLSSFPQATLLAISRSAPAPFLALAESLGVANQLRFWGPEPEIAVAYRAADLFIYPSVYDTFGMVVAEAMASGLPVIVGREIGAAELIDSENSGLLVDPSRPEDLRAALARLHGNPEFARNVGAAGRTAAVGLSWDHCAEETLRVYHRSAAQNPEVATRSTDPTQPQ